MSKIVHNIKAQLHENVLTEDPNDYVARVSSQRSLSIQEVCQSATTRGGAEINPIAMEHSIKLFFKEMMFLLCDGFSINTGTFYVSPHIKGVFNSPTELFNPEKHRVVFEFQQGAELRKEAATVNVDILGLAEAGLYIAEVIDVKSGSLNEYMTVNRNLKVKGSRLKIAGESPDVGIYFISASDGTRTKLDATDIVTNMPKELVIVVPELPAGQYQIEVCTQYSSGKNLKEPRSTTFDRMLTIS